MKVIIANQKGGAGKSTLCIMLANYLTMEKKEEVLILDMDFQASVHEKWETDWEVYKQNIRSTVYGEIVNNVGVSSELPLAPKVKLTDGFLIDLIDKNMSIYPDLQGYKPLLNSETLGETRPYEVYKKEMSEYPSLKPALDNYQDGYVILDLPGKMDDNNLVDIYQDADLILVPTGYDQMTNIATLTFVGVINAINPTVKVVFIPNRIKPGVKYELKADIHRLLGAFGTVTEEIKDSVMFQRINTYSITKDVSDSVEPIFSDLYTRFLSTKK